MKGFCDFLESHVKVRIEEDDEVRHTTTNWVFSSPHNYQETHITIMPRVPSIISFSLETASTLPWTATHSE